MFKNIWSWLTGIFSDAAKALEKPAEIVNQIVNVIKGYVYNPVIDIITALTRTGMDNAIVEKVRQYFPGVLAAMLKAENIIKDVANGDLSGLLRTLASYLNGLAPEARGKWWVEIAALLLPLITGKKIDKPLSVAVTQATYLKNAA